MCVQYILWFDLGCGHVLIDRTVDKSPLPPHRFTVINHFYGLLMDLRVFSLCYTFVFVVVFVFVELMSPHLVI